MLVLGLSTFHHYRNQFRFLLVGARQVFASKEVMVLLLDALFAIKDELIDDIEIAAQRNVDGGTARQLYGGETGFVFTEYGSGIAESVGIDAADFPGARRGLLNLKRKREGYESSNRNESERARPKQIGEALPPR